MEPPGGCGGTTCTDNDTDGFALEGGSCGPVDCNDVSNAKWATETHRDWRTHHDGSPADENALPGHPHVEKASNLTPTLRFWNRTSDNYLLGDTALMDPETGRYPTSRPVTVAPLSEEPKKEVSRAEARRRREDDLVLNQMLRIFT